MPGSRGCCNGFSSVGFPLVISGQVTIPDQVKMLKGYKKRLKKMVAARRPANPPNPSRWRHGFFARASVGWKKREFIRRRSSF